MEDANTPELAAEATSEVAQPEVLASAEAHVNAAVDADPATGGFNTTMAISLLVPLLIAVYFLFFRGSKSSGGRKLVLFGPIGGGKSALYHRLRFGRVIPTVSSMASASATFVPSGTDGGTRPATIVDVPGSGRLRVQLLDEASSAAALVCVLDATQLTSQAREAAGMLYDVLSHDPVARRQLPVLVAVNKADCTGAAAPLAARKALEQEIQRVRLARTTMEDTSGRPKVYKGIAEDDGGPFSFDALATNAVSFAATSAIKPDMTAVLDLIAGLR